MQKKQQHTHIYHTYAKTTTTHTHTHTHTPYMHIYVYIYVCKQVVDSMDSATELGRRVSSEMCEKGARDILIKAKEQNAKNTQSNTINKAPEKKQSTTNTTVTETTH